MVIGVLLISNLSIGDGFTWIKNKFRRKGEYEEDDDEIEEYDEETEEDDENLQTRKIKIHSLKELTAPIEEEKEEEEETVPEIKEAASNRYINYKLQGNQKMSKMRID